MTHDIAIMGCGGFGREVIDVIDAINASQSTWNLIGFFDDSPSEENLEAVARLGLLVVGPANRETITSSSATHYVVGIGDGNIRRSLAARADGAGLEAAVLVDPRAYIGRDVQIAPGTIVAAQAHVTTNVRLDRHVHIDRASQVGHDSRVGAFATIHPGSVVSGNCVIAEGAKLGTHSTVLPGLTIGEGAVIGASACVTTDVAAGKTVKGVPARES